MARNKSKKTTQASLPKGFQPIGGFASSWPGENTKPGEAIQGIVTGYDEVPVMRDGKKTTVELMRIEGNDGKDYTVWHSAGLAGLFDEDFTDVEVFIRFDGLGPKKRGRNPAKLFYVGADVE